MYFLIDYENTSQRGLSGINLLSSKDTIILFYNDMEKGIPANIAAEIVEKAPNFNGAKLVRPGKNNIDFYIGVTVGEILGKNPNEKIAIISGDNGYIAVYDYCKQRFNRKIIITKDICNAINIANNNLSQESEFDNIIASMSSKKEVQRVAFNKLFNDVSKKKEEKALVEANKTLCNIAKIEVNPNDLELVDIYKEVDIPFKMYNSLVHKFGKKEGKRIYTLLAEHSKESKKV